jgi:hypothetical protein
MRIRIALPAVIVTMLVIAAGAFAAKPIKGATYSGRINRTSNVLYTIKFKVSNNGTHVSGFSVPTLVYCQGGGFGSPLSVVAKITKAGTFKAKLPMYFAPAHVTEGYETVTGKFAKGGKVSGKVITTFTHGTSCNGTSTYSATG